MGNQSPSGEAAAAVSIRGLWKRFDTTVAVADLNLDVPYGSFFGLVGPNGAGKTTTLSMATGLLRPDAGQILLLGRSVWDDPFEAKRWMGVLPDGMPTFDRLTGLELLTYTGLLRGLPRDTVARRAGQLLRAMRLDEDSHTLVADYSAGMTKKISIACAIIHAPKVLFLDEPFEAIDPVSAQVIQSMLAEVVRGGGTVIMSSHVMELVERLCDNVAVVHQGKVVVAGRTEDVRGGQSLHERFVSLVDAHLDTEDLSWLRF